MPRGRARNRLSKAAKPLTSEGRMMFGYPSESDHKPNLAEVERSSRYHPGWRDRWLDCALRNISRADEGWSSCSVLWISVARYPARGSCSLLDGPRCGLKPVEVRPGRYCPSGPWKLS